MRFYHTTSLLTMGLLLCSCGSNTLKEGGTAQAKKHAVMPGIRFNHAQVAKQADGTDAQVNQNTLPNSAQITLPNTQAPGNSTIQVNTAIATAPAAQVQINGQIAGARPQYIPAPAQQRAAIEMMRNMQSSADTPDYSGIMTSGAAPQAQAEPQYNLGKPRLAPLKMPQEASSAQPGTPLRPNDVELNGMRSPKIPTKLPMSTSTNTRRH